MPETDPPTPPLDYRPAHEDQRARRPYVPITLVQLNVACGVIALVLSIASIHVVFQGAADEPYMGYRRSDAVVQVGIGTALMLLWGCFAIAVLLLTTTRKVSRWWLVVLPWAAICLFYLSYAPLGYLQDIEKFVIPPSAQGP